jgi:uncharacterized OsmC-like protein
LGVYCVHTYRQEKAVYQTKMRNSQNMVYMLYKEDEPGPNPLETLLSALSACKLVSFWDLAEKNKIDFEDVSIEITAVVGPAGRIEGTHQPRNTTKSIHSIWHIKSSQSDEQIEEYLKIVDQVCTVGSSLNPAIEFTHEIKRL